MAQNNPQCRPAPKVRVTKEIIAEFRRQIELEYRKIQTPDNEYITEEYIHFRCYDLPDDRIKTAIKQHLTPEDMVSWETY